ncbi:NepR family anti-sigma factor [uncultured Hyphomonas sp.]|uniref:NepR family anti-sigma factor n=1 Tax=uncultured Hyphomonas sp. TaxID=225298 RepID=UPI002AAB9E35|nr:NepR family anti-sigma factor [uncultured Hyphomonas sp.]
MATNEPFKRTASPLSNRERLEGAIGDALRANFKPVLDEPLPERLRELVEKLRIEEQKKKGL